MGNGRIEDSFSLELSFVDISFINGSGVEENESVFVKNSILKIAHVDLTIRVQNTETWGE